MEVAAGTTATRRGFGPAASGVFLALALAVTGCAASGPVDDGSQLPSDDLAVRPQPIATATGPAGASPTAEATPFAASAPPAGSAGAAGAGRGSGGTGSGSGSDTKPAVWRTALNLSDPSGDLGVAAGQRYADLTRVRIDDNGTQIRMTVSMAATVPGQLKDGEVLGVGIHLFRSNSRESDYQVFFDGGAESWRVFLQTPKGFVRFPGTFSMGGTNLSVTLPWNSLGGRKNASISVFADWSSRDLLRQESSDYAPDKGKSKLTVS